jgi:ribosomal protein S12 methylthiotransferase
MNRFLDAADVRLGFKEYPRIAAICHDLINESRGKTAARQAGDALRSGPTVSAAKKPVPQSYNDFLVHPRMRIGSPHSAYLKISEGCSNPCRFCAIPRMRGLQVSRPIEKIVEEAQELAEGGAQEILLIAQDTTSYGKDIYNEYRLPQLLRALQKVDGPQWFRLMYAYPKFLTEEMLDCLADDPRFCPYIDIPLQHISDPMLTAMARGVTKAQTVKLLDLIARKLPGGAIRTTFIVGFPGETEKDHAELLSFIGEGRFTHAGCFLYSHEPLAEKKARRDALMLAQQAVSQRRTHARLGTTTDVMIDGTLAESPVKGAKALGRSRLEAPEVDGVVFIKGAGAGKLAPGTIVPVEIVAASEYDLIGKVSSN